LKINQVFQKLINLPRFVKKAIILIIDVLFCFIVTWIALSLRLEIFYPLQSEAFLISSLISAGLLIPIFIFQGVYQVILRFTGGGSQSHVIVQALMIYSFFYIGIFLFIAPQGVPRSLALIQPMLLYLFVATSRLIARYILNIYCKKKLKLNKSGLAIIYGAGSAGRQLVTALNQGIEIQPICFIDDDKNLWGGVIEGLLVYRPDDIEKLLEENPNISDVLLAMPSIKRSKQRKILKRLSNLSVRVRILPSLSELANGQITIGNIREVVIDDVLGRESVKPNPDLMHKNVKGKKILITGAGGSIGSELSRKIITLEPELLILFDSNEFYLYEIERELLNKKLTPRTILVSILGNVLDRNKLINVLKKYEIETIFHAAAYKHVPLIEANPASGVLNNIFGTLNIVEVAIENQVETLVLVSTDKAVRPTNVMGCSKRISELILQAKNSEIRVQNYQYTKLCMVRFGNVLGSSGSVVPLFKEQINAGGPVSVTHPEIIRFFMTIPEAAELVIQASSIGDGGDVMVLDMGEPVKIRDLAERMIHLSGLSVKNTDNPDGDIEIIFTGLRPGEKLYEELLIGENTFKTQHKRIMRAEENFLSWDSLEPLLNELEDAVRLENGDSIKQILKRIVPEYQPYKDT